MGHGPLVGVARSRALGGQAGADPQRDGQLRGERRRRRAEPDSAYEDEAIDRWLPLRVIPLEIGAFTPAVGRMNDEHHRALAVQQEAIAAWNDELVARYSGQERALTICDVPLRS